MLLTTEHAKKDFLSGKDGIVWASYNNEQSQIIRNALLAQNIYSEPGMSHIDKKEIYLVIVPEKVDARIAMDFIWKAREGLCLKPDWHYPSGEHNKSFARWISDSVNFE